MLSYSSWLSGTLMTAAQRTEREQERAADAWQRINEDPSTITLRTAAGSNRAVQVVRLEVDNRSSDSISARGAAPKMQAIGYGIRGHARLPRRPCRKRPFVYPGTSPACCLILRQGQIRAS